MRLACLPLSQRERFHFFVEITTAKKLSLLFMQCDWQEIASVHVCTSSKIGAIPLHEIDLVMRSSTAALQDAAFMGHQHAFPLVEYGLGVYRTHLEALLQLQPQVLLTCLATEQPVVESALRSVLGYAPQARLPVASFTVATEELGLSCVVVTSSSRLNLHAPLRQLILGSGCTIVR
jgi:hypothetical protein